MYQPWLAHFYPGATMESLAEGYWSVSAYVAMRDYVKGQEGGAA